MIIKIKDRAFIGIKGVDKKSFLQGICTINIDNINEGFGGWGAMLSPHGRFQYGFFVFEYNDMLYLETSSNNLMEFGALLSKYIMASKVEFSIEQNINVYADTTPTATTGTITTDNNKIILNDPRSSNIGSRLYMFNNGQMDETGTIENYEKLRIENTIVDLEIDGIFNKSFVLELNMDKLNGVDFEKGCFVGQEIIARMHYKSGVKNNTYTIESENPLNIGDVVMTDDNKKVGKVSSSIGNMGLAILRNHYTDNDLFVDGDRIKILSG